VLAYTVPVPGDPDALVLGDAADPEPQPGEVVVDVAGVGVNRADLLQRQGHYDPPPGTSPIPGMEVSGRVSAVGRDVHRWQIGDEVCALLTGGGYAHRVAVPEGQLLPVPRGVGLVSAAALPEVTCTVWSNVFMVAGLRAGETLLVHGGGSGIGTMAIQLAHAAGARVIVTVGSQRKADACVALGADHAINYRESDFVAEVDERTQGRGADVILDVIGASYLARNVHALAAEGRLVVIGLQGGARGELDLGRLMAKRAALIATTLRARPAAEKTAIVAAVEEHVWPLIDAGDVAPVIDQVLPFTQAAAAHAAMAESGHIGKILLGTGVVPGSA
jgi:putative PIG3 family NAD(P)H quinone oxidoreductase